MITPCKNLCKLANGVCTGCGRTSTEIQQWTLYSPEKRLEIMYRLSTKHNNTENIRRYDKG